MHYIIYKQRVAIFKGVMEINKKGLSNHVFMPIIISLFYTIYFYVVVKFIIEFNMLIRLNNITLSNLGTKFISDFLVTLLVPLILAVIYRKKLLKFKLQFKHTYLQYILITIMILLFLLNGDFTIRGLYKFFFYLVMVGFAEEFLFRGYVYNELLIHNKLLAVIVSGFFWGILHAILPGLLAGEALGQIGIRMLSHIGGAIVSGYYFIYLLEKSKSLFIPVFVHAILDYSVGGIGVLTAIGTGVYLFKLDRKN